MFCRKSQKLSPLSEKIVEKVPGDVYKKSCAEFRTELTLIKLLNLDQTAGFTQPARAFLSNYLVSGGGGVAKVSCILRHWGIQLILAYSWARLAILVAGLGRGGMFYSIYSLSFLFLFFPYPSLSSSLLSHLSLSLGDDTK